MAIFREISVICTVGIALISGLFAMTNTSLAKEAFGSFPEPKEALGGMTVEVFQMFGDERLWVTES